jgi:hypothetical protein
MKRCIFYQLIYPIFIAEISEIYGEGFAIGRHFIRKQASD